MPWGESKSSSSAAKGFSERSVPVIFVKSAKASMINWELEVEDVACPTDDMKTTGCSERRETEGREKGEQSFRPFRI